MVAQSLYMLRPVLTFTGHVLLLSLCSCMTAAYMQRVTSCCAVLLTGCPGQNPCGFGHNQNSAVPIFTVALRVVVRVLETRVFCYVHSDT